MGLVKHLLLWPVTGPKALIDFSVRQVENVAHRELTDDERVKEDLMALELELELGDIDQAEYERREAILMERLREARAWRTKLGMEEEWAPLSFSGSGGAVVEGPGPVGGEDADPAQGADAADEAGSDEEETP
jgi:hypothetical protein